MRVDQDTLIEEIVTTIPGSVTYLMQQGIRCIACGEPIWGTLGDAAKAKGFQDSEIARFVDDLNTLQLTEASAKK